MVGKAQRRRTQSINAMIFDPTGDQELQLNAILNSGLTFWDNFDSAILEVELRDGRNTIFHGLGRVPSGFLVLYTEDNISITGDTIANWTGELIYIESSGVSSRVRLLIL